MTQNNKKNKSKVNNKKSIYFMILMMISYGLFFLINKNQALDAVDYVIDIFKDLIPILIFVYIFMVAMSFIHEKKLKKTIERVPMLVKYILMSILGTLSHGPIYAWYPFLKDLNEKGISKGHVASFLYARGIKLTLLPMLISFFDLKFAIILSIVIFIFAIIQGIFIDLTDH